ncbi:MAG TPA: hypothetical protein VI011_17850 [Asanoa sp.]
MDMFDGWSRQDMLALFQVASGVLALVIALWALVAAYAQARKSGQDVFESNVLRDLLGLTDKGIPDLGVTFARLAMLPDDAVPFWRAWAKLRFQLDGSEELDARIEAMKPPPEAVSTEDRYVWALREDIRRTAMRKGYRTSRLGHRPPQQPPMPQIWYLQ